MYKPNFCAECGARVERVRWRLWTSRRFCANCAPRFRRARLLLPVVAGVTLLLSGFVAGRLLRPASQQPLVINRSQAAPATKTQVANSIATISTSPQRFGPDGTAGERPTDPGEVVSTCGARTKKGTPCSRRVRGTGRCWQHKGKPAMLPPEKLIVRG